jgi:membrane protease YdiL (CAAX protease family)
MNISAIKSPNKSTQSMVARVPWNAGLGVFWVIVVFVLSQVLAAVIISLYPSLKHWSHQEALGWLTNSVTGQFLYILLTESLSILAVFGFVRRYKASPSIIGLRKPKWTDLLYGLSAVPVYYLLYILTVGVVSHFVTGLNINQTQEIGFNNVHTGLDLALTFISLVILPPLTEEIMVRGLLYSSFKKALPLVWAATVTSALFAAAHLGEGGATGPLYIAALDTFVLSLVLIYLREKTGGLWSSMTLHAIKNGIAFVALFVLHAR